MLLDKILNIPSLKNKRVILPHSFKDFSLWSLDSKVENSCLKCMAKECASPNGSQEARRKKKHKEDKPLEVPAQ